MIDYRRLMDWKFPVIEHSYTRDDTMRYALALGLGDDPMDPGQLQFVNDTVASTPLAFPTMAVVLGFPGSWMTNPATGIDFAKIVHGEEGIVLHKPLAAEGTVVAHHRVISVIDKGEGRGAIVSYDKELFDKASGDKLATVRHVTFARGNGGFSAGDGLTDASPPAPPRPPVRAPDRVLEIRTLPQQALLYRMCADRNPLHSDPAAAQAGGFARPILHGLCTYGIACRAILATWCALRPERLKNMFARFSAPVFPGETIRVEMYADGLMDADGLASGEIAFRAISVERNVTVLDAGRAGIAP